MRELTIAGVRANAGRLVASTVAIVIAVAFVVATLVLNETSASTVFAATGAEYVEADVVVVSDDYASLEEEAAVLAGLASVRAVAPTVETSVQAVVPGRGGAQYVQVEAVADDPSLRWQQVASGALPTGLGEVAVNERLGAGVGDVLDLTTFDNELGTTATSTATVVGVVDLGGDPTASVFGRAFATTGQVRAWGAGDPVQLRVAGTGAAPDALAAEVRAALDGSPVTVRTGTEQAEAEAAELTGDTVALTTTLLAFAAVAVLVAGLVIANTFAVLLAQRTRELAMLRCVGATARQVRRSVLAESLVIGIVASVLGVVAGVGLAAAVSAIAAASDSPVPLSGLSVPPVAVVAGLVLGTVVTVVAALAPARAATRLSPLAALRPVDPAPVRSRSGAGRLVLGLLLLLPGAGLLAMGVVAAQALLAVAGGAVSALGVVVLAQRAVPPVVAAVGRLVGRVGGVPGELAAGNAGRNPRRTAATATALLIGVTLTTAMVVGAASTRSTATAALDSSYPTDVVVEGQGSALPEALLTDLLGIDGVAAVAPVLGAEVQGPDGEPARVLGYDVTVAQTVLRSDADTPLPQPGVAVVPTFLADVWGLATGDRLTLTSQGRSLTTEVQVVPADQRLAITVQDLGKLAPDAVTDSVWLRLDDDGDRAQSAAVDRVTDAVGTAVPLAQVSGAVSVRAALDDLLDVLLLVVTGLLGVAVVIALIGVGNTLALSVVERRQESGLLRALGLSRRQLRATLAWEAVLVAAVAAVMGVVLGCVYGLAGTASVLGSTGDVILTVPWAQVAAIVVASTLAGLLASVLPARRAARISPVSAIAA